MKSRTLSSVITVFFPPHVLAVLIFLMASQKRKPDIPLAGYSDIHPCSEEIWQTDTDSLQSPCFCQIFRNLKKIFPLLYDKYSLAGYLRVLILWLICKNSTANSAHPHKEQDKKKYYKIYINILIITCNTFSAMFFTPFILERVLKHALI